MAKKDGKLGKTADTEFWISGYNAVWEKLRANNPIREILVQKGMDYPEIIKKAEANQISWRFLEKDRLDVYTDRHQGLIAICPDYTYVEVETLLEKALAKGEPPFLLLLDQITDPHNLGAMIRTAHQAGCHGLIIPQRRSASITEVVAKTSAGAVEYLPVAQVTNLNRCIDFLKKQGLWVAGADMDGQTVYQADLTGPLAVVIGSEGEGISRLTREKCDFIVSIPMYGQIDSLNASVSAGIILYEALRQRRFR